MPVTSIVKDCMVCDKYANKDIPSLLLFSVLIESFLRSVDWETEGRAFEFSFYCAYDPGVSRAIIAGIWVAFFQESQQTSCGQDEVYDDPVLRAEVEARAASMLGEHGAKLVLVRVERDATQLEWGNIMPLWNAVADRAALDGAEYFYLVNDDLELVTPGWATTLTSLLRHNPLRPNFGVAAGVGYEGEEARNATHGNFPMVHRTHLEIFGSLYPTTFSNWYADPWVCDIYQPFGSFFHAAAGDGLPDLPSLLVVDRQPFRYIRNNLIPDGWFDYPDATNSARRALQQWLATHATAGPDAVVLMCPEGLAFCRPVAVASLELRWCLAPRDGRFFGRTGDHKLSCANELWHPRLECWIPGLDHDVDFTGHQRQDRTARHLGTLCTVAALEEDASKEAAAAAEAAGRTMDFTIPDGAQVGETLRTSDPTGRPVSFVLPAGVSPGQVVTLNIG